LEDSDPGNRAVAAEAVATVLHGIKMSDADPAAAYAAAEGLLVRLGDPEPAVRARAASALLSVSLLWPGMPRIIDMEGVSDAFVGLVNDPNEEVRVAAVRGLGLMGHWLDGDPPARLVEALADDAEAVRTAASQELCLYRRGLVRLLPGLVKAAETARPECRPAYLGVFWSLSPRSTPDEPDEQTLAAVVAALRSRDAEVRCRMLAVLAEYGARARPHLAALLAQLDEKGAEAPGDPRADSSEKDSVVAAAATLARVAGSGLDFTKGGSQRIPAVREALPRVMGLLGSRVPARRLAAIQALGAFEPDYEHLAALVPCCRDPDAAVRAAAIRGLANNAAGWPLLTPERLVAALDDPAAGVRAASASAAPASDGVEAMVPALIRHAESDADTSVRYDCAWALSNLGPPRVSKAIVPLCVEAIGRRDAPPALKRGMAQVLGRFGRDARPAVPALVRILLPAVGADASLSGPRRRARLGIMMINLPGHEPTVAEMRATQSIEEEILMRVAAAESLGRIAPGAPEAAEAVRGLSVALGDRDEVAISAVAAIAAFGPEARAALPALADALRHARADRQAFRTGAIADAMGRIGPSAPESAGAIAFLVEIVKGDDVTPRGQAERLLGLFGPSAVAAVPRMVELSRRPFVRKTEEIGPLATALGQIAPGTAEEAPALAALVDLLNRDGSAHGAEAVIAALSRFGQVAAAASHRLRELADADNPRIRAAVRQALASIEPDVARSPVAR
ncbi:MAG: hypothetical protein ACYC61_09900, partial [Isosphaeraceae bacterium]